MGHDADTDPSHGVTPLILSGSGPELVYLLYYGRFPCVVQYFAPGIKIRAGAHAPTQKLSKKAFGLFRQKAA